jgi:hypothetical protein
MHMECPAWRVDTHIAGLGAIGAADCSSVHQVAEVRTWECPGVVTLLQRAVQKQFIIVVHGPECAAGGGHSHLLKLETLV